MVTTLTTQDAVKTVTYRLLSETPDDDNMFLYEVTETFHTGPLAGETQVSESWILDLLNTVNDFDDED